LNLLVQPELEEVGAEAEAAGETPPATTKGSGRTSSVPEK